MTETEELAAVLAALARRMQRVVDGYYDGGMNGDERADVHALNEARALLERLGYK